MATKSAMAAPSRRAWNAVEFLFGGPGRIWRRELPADCAELTIRLRGKDAKGLVMRKHETERELELPRGRIQVSRRVAAGAIALIATSGCATSGNGASESNGGEETVESNEGAASGPGSDSAPATSSSSLGFDPVPNLPGRNADWLIGATPENGIVTSVSTAVGAFDDVGARNEIQLVEGSSKIQCAAIGSVDEDINFSLISSDGSLREGLLVLRLLFTRLIALDREPGLADQIHGVRFEIVLVDGEYSPEMSRAEGVGATVLIPYELDPDEVRSEDVSAALRPDYSVTDDVLTVSFSQAPFIEEFGEFTAWHASIITGEMEATISRMNAEIAIPAWDSEALNEYLDNEGGSGSESYRPPMLFLDPTALGEPELPS